ncbi:MAG: transposase, partial [Thermoplasmataceae archaeon]
TWSPYQLEQFIEYKAEDRNKSAIYVNPKYTSQRCSNCGYIDKNNRKGSIFHCQNCNFELHADLNAARNIGILGKSEYFRLLSTSQSLRHDPQNPDSNKPLPSGRGS